MEGTRGSILARVDDDIASLILSFVPAHLLCAIAQLNKRFLRLASHDSLWHTHLRRELGESSLPTCPSPPGSWRRRFWQWQRLDCCGYEEQTPQLRAPQVS